VVSSCMPAITGFSADIQLISNGTLLFKRLKT